MALARAVLTDLHWLRQLTDFQDGLPGLVCAFRARARASRLQDATGNATNTKPRSRLVADAIEAQDLRVLAALDRLAAQPHYANDICFDGALELAASQGRPEALQWLLSRRRSPQAPGSTTQLLEAVVSGSGDVATAAWLVAHYPEAARSLSSAAISTAASNGHLGIVQWVHNSGQFESAFQPLTMDSAAGSGRSDIITFLHDHRREGCTPQAAVQAAQHGHLAVLRLLFQWYPQYFTSTPDVLDAAALSGAPTDRLAIVQFLHETARAPCTFAAIDNAAAQGDLELVAYLLAQRCEGFSSRALTSAARAGHLEMVRLLLHHLEQNKDTAMDLTRAIAAAAQAGHIDAVRLLLKAIQGKPHRNVSGAIRVAAAWGHVEIVRLLVAEGEWLSLLDAVSQASYQGHQEIVELLKQASRARQSQARAY